LEKNPLVSVIIVNYNGRKLLENCFESLSKVTYTSLETIFVDNNSDDDSVHYVEENYPETRIIKLEKNHGFAKPNNIGAKKAKGEYLLFLNNDTKVTTNFMDNLVKVMEKDPKIGMCQSLLLKSDGKVDSSGDFIDHIGIAYSSKEMPTKVCEILSAKGASMIMRKNLFDNLGGFDEEFYVSFEDVDLGWRTWIFGYKVVVVPNSIVYHLGGQTTKDMKKEIAFHGFKNQLAMKITNFESSVAMTAVPLFFFIYGFRMLKVSLDYFFKGETKITATKYEDKLAQKLNFATIFKGIIWNWTNIRYLMRKRKILKKNRKFSTKELMKKKVIVK